MKALVTKYPWLNTHQGRQAVFYANLNKDYLDEVKEDFKGLEDFINDKEKVQLVYEMDSNYVEL